MKDYLLKRKIVMKVRIKNPIYGVPITFIYHWNPDQFKILGETYSTDKSDDVEKIRTDPRKRHTPFVNGKEKYTKILIQRIS